MKYCRIFALCLCLGLLLCGCGELKSAPPRWSERIAGEYDTLVGFRWEAAPFDEADVKLVLQGVDSLTNRPAVVFVLSDGAAAFTGEKLSAGAVCFSWRRLSIGETEMLESYFEERGGEESAVWGVSTESACAVSCILPCPTGWLEVTADAPGLSRAELVRALDGLTVRVDDALWEPRPAAGL